jgi:two-component system, response regulator, stage 0 sporulation protein F
MTEPVGRILIVDDELSVVEVLGEYFTGQGYSVATATDGAEALGVVERFRPAVILLDVRMPGMDGVEVLRRLRVSDNNPAVIMVTANEDVALARETLKLGAFDYVAKPFDFAYLDQAVTLGFIQSGGGPAAESGTRGADAGDGPEGAWRALALAVFRVARNMTPAGRESTGQRLESAALAAARDSASHRPDAAASSLLELDTLLTVAGEMGDVSPAAQATVRAAITAARASLAAAR